MLRRGTLSAAADRTEIILGKSEITEGCRGTLKDAGPSLYCQISSNNRLVFLSVLM